MSPATSSFGLIVVDANIVLRGLRSRNGASHRILRGMIEGEIAFALSPAVVLEYEDVLMRPGLLGDAPWIAPEEIGTLIDALCALCVEVSPAFRFRPFLADPKDDLYVECALAAGARLIVSEDRHFRHPALAAFGVEALTAPAFEALWRQSRSMS
jgi:Predicted nucleic acid-binding protein, contains PIN domain